MVVKVFTHNFGSIFKYEIIVTNELIYATATVILDTLGYKIRNAYRESPYGKVGWKPKSGKLGRML